MPKLIDESVLVLNKYYQAIQVTTAREAICAVITGKAKVIDYNYTRYDWNQWVSRSAALQNEPGKDMYAGIIHSPSTKIYIPQVIHVQDCEHTKSILKKVRFSRKSVFQRDEFHCMYCKKEFDRKKLTIDHVIPRSRGGTNAWNNVVACCKPCNTKKGDKPLSQLGWKIDKKLTEPQWKSHINKKFNEVKQVYWETFLPKELT